MLVAERLQSMWTQAIAAGPTGQPILDGLAFEFNTQTPGVLDWISERGAEFITRCTEEQKDAIAALLEKKMRESHTVDELARLIRPCIGLTEGDARANARYYDNIVATMRKEHPRMKVESIRRKALDASQKYAEKQHRARAFTIAQTESAFAYNRGADEGIRQAQATVDELQKLTQRLGISLPPCHVIPLGADFAKQEIITEDQVPKNVVEAVQDRPYILMVGTIEPRKNHKLLLEAYDKGLKEMGYNIIMAGYMGWNMEEFEQKLESHPDYGKRIFHFTGLDDKAIAFLYQHAKFLAFCSYTEGFGLPIIEAIQRGTPVLAADVPVLREVGGDYCVWFEQDDAGELCEAVCALANSSGWYEKLKNNNKCFHAVTWEKCHSMMDKVLKS